MYNAPVNSEILAGTLYVTGIYFTIPAKRW